MPILGSLMDFALSTPDYCRRLLLPSQVARDEKKAICRWILTKLWKKRIIDVELQGFYLGVGEFYCKASLIFFWPKRSVSGLLGTVTKWKLATLSRSDAVNVAHSARSLVQTRTKQCWFISYHHESSCHIILVRFRHIYEVWNDEAFIWLTVCAFIVIYDHVCAFDLSECNQGTAQRSPQTRGRRIRTHRSPCDAVCRHAAMPGFLLFCSKTSRKRQGPEQDAVLRRPPEARKQSWFRIWKAFV